ncbi:hypothetical protein F4780DRAFT_788464 [Xylariomycetidae sp. FL0641]|nr:hypothetical protein F4780DRAFT_788464 [Xylariomycetidae sp. FL0641]
MPHQSQSIAADRRNNSYQTTRVFGAVSGELYLHWCTSETGLLHAILLATESCADQTCGNLWELRQSAFLKEEVVVVVVAGEASRLATRFLSRALGAAYGRFFNAIPWFALQAHASLQLLENEQPYLPGNRTDNYEDPTGAEECSPALWGTRRCVVL